MRLFGKTVNSPSIEHIIIPREPKDIVLVACAVTSNDEFDKLYPPVLAPKIQFPGKPVVEDVTDAEYLKAVAVRGEAYSSWLLLKSLSATPTLEWETVKLNDPSTWKNVNAELQSAGFTAIEISRIYQGVASANGLNEDKVKKARERFFATLPQTGS